MRPPGRFVSLSPLRISPPKSLSKDVGESWLDLTKLVSGGGGNKSPYDDLAADIGKQVCDARPVSYTHLTLPTKRIV